MALSSTEIARRLKAGRWLAGREDDDGKPLALPVSELVERDPLKANRISHNRIQELEQARVDEPRQMELEKIAEALGLPACFFEDEDWRGLVNSSGETGAPPSTEELVNLRSALISTVARARKEIERLQRLLPPDEQMGGANRNS